MIRGVVAGLAGLGALMAAGAAGAQADGIQLRSATWIESNYPEFARNFLLSGEALLNCRPAAQGKLTCKVVKETPEGFGFGAAAMDVAWGSRFDAAGLKAAAAHGGSLDFPVHFTQRPIPAIGGGPPTPEALALSRAIIRMMGPAPELRMLGREYQEAEAIGLEKLSPTVRAAAGQAFATLRAEAPSAAARTLGRMFDQSLSHTDLARVAGLLNSPAGDELITGLAAAHDQKAFDAAIGAWLAAHPTAAGELAPLVALLGQGEELASASAAVETLRQELIPTFRADLCRRVACHPADMPKP